MEKLSSKQKRIVGIIVDHLSVSEDKVTPEAHFYNDLGADSLDLVEMLMAVEEAFDIEVEDEVAETWETVGHVFSTIGS